MKTTSEQLTHNNFIDAPNDITTKPNRHNNNNNKFVERHSAVASEALAAQVSQLYAVLNK